MNKPPGKPNLREVFSQPNFRKLWLAQFVSVFGDFLAMFAVISTVTFRWNGSAAHVTYVFLAYMMPFAFVSPIAGVFVDRWPVKRVMIASDVIRGVLVLFLPWVSTLPQIYAVFVALALVSSFFQPAQSIALRTLVEREKLMAANALMSQAFYVVRLASPVAAGALVAWLGETSCYYIDVFSFFFSAAVIARLPIQRTPAERSKTFKGFLADLTSGNRFIFSHPTLAFVIVSMVSPMFVVSCLGPLFSIYVRDILHGGALAYGIVSSGIGIGLIAGTQFVNAYAHERSKKTIVLTGLIVSAFGVALLGVFGAISAAIATTVIMGFGISFVAVAAQTMMQQETPPELLGRVSSSFMSLFALAQTVGLLVSANLAVWIGIRAVFLVSASALFAIAGVGFFQHKPAPAVPASV